jgi:hypothetical protein
MRPVDNTNSILTSPSESTSKIKGRNSSQAKSDSIEISNTAKVYDNDDKFLNLGNSDRTKLSKMNAAEKDEFLKMLATTLKKGIVGYEVLNVNGKPEKHFVENEIGDERIYGAKLYKKKGYSKD